MEEAALAIAAMSPETQIFLPQINTLVRENGSLKNAPYKPDLERPRCRQDPKLKCAFGFTDELPDPTVRGLTKNDPLCMDEDLIQIFIKLIGGKHYCMRLSKGWSIQALKKEIEIQLGTPTNYQNLIYSGHSMQDNQTLQHYGIIKDSTIILNLRLHGRCNGTSSKNTGSFRDAVKGKDKMQNKPAPPPELPGPYIVEQKPESPTLQVSLPEVTNLHADLSKNVVICIFNGF